MHSKIANLLLHSYFEAHCCDTRTARFTCKDMNASCTVTTTLIENTAPQHVFFLAIKTTNRRMNIVHRKAKPSVLTGHHFRCCPCHDAMYALRLK